MKDYLQSLSERMIDSHNTDTKQIRTSFRMRGNGDGCGQLIALAFKYALPENQRGKLEINLRKNMEKRIHFGLPRQGVGKTAIIKKQRGFGSQLVQMLWQINGQLRLQSNQGMITRIQFSLN